MVNPMTDDTTPYEIYLKTNHVDGNLRLYVYYPYWHDKGCWHGIVEVFYKNEIVGEVGRCFKLRNAAIEFVNIEADKLKISFDPNKRKSEDDLNWWIR